ncbi:6714_t:CDS:2 [Cetraspora pellucida]|uniref:6714_t:CDS:1 n=1 Tax=Cetraspora pellucida TaxID=1433469 RepID=A0ACA9KEI4_9GLOM|nr:6714_t:CDS:2 [Cetraspora pellucida]
MGKKKQKNQKSTKSSNTTNDPISPTTTLSADQSTNATTSTTDATHQSHSNSHHTRSQHAKSTDHNKEPQQSNDIEQDSVLDEQQKEQKGFKGQAKKDMQNVEGYVAERDGEVIDEAKLDKDTTIAGIKLGYADFGNASHHCARKHVNIVSVNEMDVTKAIADKYLRENKGNVVDALKAIVNAC